MIQDFLLLVLAFAGLAWGLWQRRENRIILVSIEKMLDGAQKNALKDFPIDESRLSKIESDFHDFLLAKEVGEEGLSREKEVIESLISDISHQTKTPISNILLYTDLLKEEEDPKKQNHYLSMISSQSDKLHFLIESLVKMSRLEVGMLNINRSLLNLDDIVIRVIESLKKRAGDKEIDIAFSLSGVQGICDLKWTEEALYNILENAIKYSPPRSKIKVKVEAFELFSVIRVSDQGIGIQEDELGYVYQRFYRSPRVYKEEGLGIGLYLSQKIIMDQGGYLKIGQNSKGGTDMSIYLPRD